MDKIFKIFVLFLGLIGLASLGACSDEIDPEITELNVSRLFTPTGVDVRIINQTDVRVSWNRVKGASHYEVNFYEGAAGEITGAPVESFPEVIEELVEVAGFDGETDYTVVIKAVGEGIADSKLLAVSFTTGTEQIFENLNPEGLTATSVILNWPAGEHATSIVLTPESGDAVEYELTASDVEAGMFEISELQGETTYTAKLMNEDKTRGTMVFTTLIDLGGATAVYPEDNLAELIQAAEDGVTLALFPGEYLVGTGSVDITKNISIVAVYPTDKPVLHSRFILSGIGNLNFTIKDVILSGFTVEEGVVTETRDTYVLDLTNGAEFGTVRLTNVEISDFQRSLLRGTSGGGDIQNFIVENSLIYRTDDGNNEFIDLRSGRVQNISLLNSTFAKVASTRMFIRADAIAGFEGQNILIENSTFYDVAMPSAIWLRIRTILPNVTLRKNLFVNIGTGVNELGINADVYDNNYVEAAAISGFDSSAKSYDPAFVNADEFDFTVQEDEIIFGAYGDPRWR